MKWVALLYAAFAWFVYQAPPVPDQLHPVGAPLGIRG